MSNPFLLPCLMLLGCLNSSKNIEKRRQTITKKVVKKLIKINHLFFSLCYHKTQCNFRSQNNFLRLQNKSQNGGKSQLTVAFLLSRLETRLILFFMWKTRQVIVNYLQLRWILFFKAKTFSVIGIYWKEAEKCEAPWREDCWRPSLIIPMNLGCESLAMNHKGHE